MCGIFGVICASDRPADRQLARALAIALLRHSETRGREAVGVAIHDGARIHVMKQAGSVSAFLAAGKLDGLLDQVIAEAPAGRPLVLCGHSRLATNGDVVVRLSPLGAAKPVPRSSSPWSRPLMRRTPPIQPPTAASRAPNRNPGASPSATRRACVAVRAPRSPVPTCSQLLTSHASSAARGVTCTTWSTVASFLARGTLDTGS